jgi:hypothetical protein
MFSVNRKEHLIHSFLTVVIRFLNISDGSSYVALGEALVSDLAAICVSNPSASMKLVRSRGLASGRSPAWLKFDVILDELKDPALTPDDWIVWVDSDVVVVQPSLEYQPLFASDKDMLISVDAYGICTGVFAVRATKWAQGLLMLLVQLGPTDSARLSEFDGHERHEQNTLKVVLRYFPDVRAHVGVIPESVIQNRRSVFSPQAWMFHFWMGGRTVDEVLRKRFLIRKDGWTPEVFEEVIQFENQTWEDLTSVAQRSGFSAIELSEYLRIPRTNPAALSRKNAALLVRFANLSDSAIRVFKCRERVRAWFLSPAATLSNEAPMASVLNERGFRAAERALIAQLPDPLLS